MVKPGGEPHRSSKKEWNPAICSLVWRGWTQGMLQTADPFPALHCAALWVWSPHPLSWWVHPCTAPTPGTNHVRKSGGHAGIGEKGECLLGGETGQSVERLTFESGGGRDLWEVEAWRYALWIVSAGRVWRPAKEQRLSPCVRISVQPKRRKMRRRGVGVEEEEAAVEGRCSLCMGQGRVRL